MRQRSFMPILEISISNRYVDAVGALNFISRTHMEIETAFPTHQGNSQRFGAVCDNFLDSFLDIGNPVNF